MEAAEAHHVFHDHSNNNMYKNKHCKQSVMASKNMNSSHLNCSWLVIRRRWWCMAM
ncbi:hypothetical protein DsansV1_C06g0063011 [Dioscorea sansibarensis]